MRGLLAGKTWAERDPRDENGYHSELDGPPSEVGFTFPEQLVLCDSDRAVYVLDRRTVRYVHLPEVDQKMFAKPERARMLGNWMDEVARVMQDAKRHLHSKNWPRAIAIYKESIETGLLESSEDVSNAHFNLIRAFAESGDQSQAAEWQDKLIALGLKDQNTSLTLISRGASHREASAHRDHNRWALTAFTDAIETGKALHIAYWNRSLLHREMKQFDLELADLQSAIAAPTDLVLSDHRAECHARIMVLLRMQRKRPRADPTNSAAAAAAAAAASTDLNALELQNESLSFAHSAHLQFIEASERVKKLKSELSAANRYFAQTTQRLYSDRGYLEGVLRLILQSTGSGGLWVVSDLISLIAEYAVRRTAIVVRCDDGGGGGGGGLRAPEAIGLTFGGSRLISAVGSWVAIRSAPHQIKERVSSFPVELGERHEKLRFCPYPHDPERIIFVSHFHLHILNLVSKDVTAIGYGSQAVTIHHNSRAKQHAGKLYSFRCNELESVNLKGLKTNQIPKSRLQLLSSDSWEATAVVFDKSSLDSSILYFTVAGRHDSDAHSIRSFDLKTQTSRVIPVAAVELKYTSVDCTGTGLLVVTAYGSNAISTLDPKTGVMKVLTRIDAHAWGTAMQSFGLQQVVLCDRDRAAYVLDSDHLLYVTLPELDQSMFVEPNRFGMTD